MIKDIIAVKPLDGYKLRLKFDDGVEGVLDVSEIVPFEGVFEPLKDKSLFDKVRLNTELGIIEWEGGVDLDPVVLYYKIIGKPVPEYGRMAGSRST